ncbi:MAG: TIR domain-containing protein [Anaerolineae bacterium]
MADVFISYSRKDIAFARILHQALQDNSFETWIDWQDIPPSSEWLTEVYQAIEQADTFVFLISQSSVASEICSLEVAHASRNSKRLIPVVINDIDPHQVTPELAALNWLFFREQDDFSQVLQDLIHAIQTDQAWVKEHTRLQVRALEWERHSRESGYLLHGSDLEQAEQWLVRSPDKQPRPTALQTQCLLASRRAATRRQRITLGAVLTGLLIAVALGVLAWTQRNEAVTQESLRATAQANAETSSTKAVAESQVRATAEAVAVSEAQQRATAEAEAVSRASIARSRQLAIASTVQLGRDQELALLLAIEAGREADTAEAADALRQSLVHPGRTLHLLLGHNGAVHAVDWDLQGERVVSAGADGTARVWDTHTGEELQTLRGHAGAVVDAVWDPGGIRIAMAGIDGTARVWDADSGREQVLLDGPAQALSVIAWSPDGLSLLTAGEDGAARIWDAATGDELLVLSPDDAPLTHAAWSPDGGRILTGSRDGAAVWDAETGQLLASRDSNQRSVSALAWAADGARIVIGDLWEATIWDTTAPDAAAEGETAGTPVTHEHAIPGMEAGSVIHASWSGDDNRLLTVSVNSTAEIWDATTGQGLGFLLGHTAAVRHGAWSPDDSLVVTASDDGTARIWESHSGIEAARLTGHRGPVNDVAWSSDGARVATAGADGTLRIWAANALDEIGAFDAGPQEYSQWSADGRLLLTGGYGSYVWDPASGAELASVQGEAAWNPVDGRLLTVDEDDTVRLWDSTDVLSTGDSSMASVAVPGSAAVWSPDGARVITMLEAGPATIWDASSGERTADLQVANGVPEQLQWSPDGSRLAGVTGERNVSIWDTRSGKELLSLPETSADSTGIWWSPDGTQLVTADGLSATVWDDDTGARLAALSAEDSQLSYAAWSPDGRQIVTVSPAQLWDVPTAVEPVVFSGQRRADHAAWNPDGTVVAAACIDNAARLWDATTGRELASMEGFIDAVRHVAWSPDGMRLVVTTWAGPARVYHVPLTNIEEIACTYAVRNMTQVEWVTQMGTTPYAQTCRGKPQPDAQPAE